MVNMKDLKIAQIISAKRREAGITQGELATLFSGAATEPFC
jgi:hypothetical protein